MTEPPEKVHFQGIIQRQIFFSKGFDKSKQTLKTRSCFNDFVI